MENLETLLEAWEKDCDINLTEPGKEIINISKLHSKYLKVLVRIRLQLKKVRNDYAEARKIRWSYYNGHYNTNKDMLKELGLEPFKFILKQDLSVYLESDKDLIKFTDKIAYYDEMIKALEFIMAELKQRSWTIRTFVEWEKFVQGA